MRRDFALSASFVLECGFDVSDEAGGYNVFDSYARDMYHNSHSEGKCVLWGGGEDVNSILNTCFLIYCSFNGDFCTEKIKIKKITD